MAFNNIQRQMQDEMARFEAEISGAVSAPVQSSTQRAPSLPRPPAPPSSLMALASKGPSNLFLPPQLQKAGIRPAAGSFSGPQQTGGAAIISNKPVLYKEKSGAPEEPAAKKPKAPEPSPVKPIAAPAKPAVVVPAPQVPSASYAEPSSSGAKIGLALKAPSSTIGSAAVKPPTEKKAKQKKPKKIVRAAGGTVWQDDSLLDWDPNDFRIFCGDLGNDVTDEVLARVFGRFPSFQRAKVIRDKRSNKSKGFGFVSFKDPQDFIRAMKELNGKYVGSRPIKLRKSNWKSRNIEEVKKKKKEKEVLLGKR